MILSLSAPSHMVTSGFGTPAELDSDDVTQTGNSSSGLQASDNKGGTRFPMLFDDGYNWRKYGQKHVKGSEFPRSYYKCAHLNCEVKKLFERSYDGQIKEIIYKGTHDHPKPQPICRNIVGAVIPVQEGSDQFSSFPVKNETDNSSNLYGQVSQKMEPSGTPELSPAAANDETATAMEDEDDPFSKRRKMETGDFDVTPVVKPIREPRVVVQTVSEFDILDDGYRWRKYGQKVVRGNPNPRGYYKCINAGCLVRKHVERSSQDQRAVITTYEGKHNHDVPTAKTNSHGMARPTAVNGPSRIQTDEKEVISLDLGVGIRSSTDNRSHQQQQQLHSEPVQSQAQTSSFCFGEVRGSPTAVFYGVINSGINQYGSGQNPGDGHVEIIPTNHSYPYSCNLGKILTGP